MSNPFFSIILPTQNGEDRIHQAVYSIASQTFKDWELIVVLDSCTDDTEKVVKNTFLNKKFENDMSKVKFIRTDVCRDGLARNAGLDAATGKWILFIDDDDCYVHEYCFEKLADQLRITKTDVLDFSFVWKGRGHMDPTPSESFVMVWCRAWRRDFIGDNRFNDLPYGSDKEFYERMILNNPNEVAVSYWHFTMYYYNYMRVGSLSWHEKQQAKLDIIVTHYDEPEEVWRPFFNMLALQRNVDFSDICVTVVNTYNEYRIEEKDVSMYPYKVRITYETNHSPCEARYYATCNTDAPWIMYCNCDDMFADVCSLSQILSQFPNDDYDILWCSMIRESIFSNHTKYLNCVDEPNFTNTDGKLYRREFIEQNTIYSEISVDKYYYDYIFGAVCMSLVAPHRIAKVVSDFRLYFKSYRKDSLRHTYEAANKMINEVILRDKNILDILMRKSDRYHCQLALARLILRQYMMIYEPAVINKAQAKSIMFSGNLIDIYRGSRSDFLEIGREDLEAAFNEVKVEVLNTIQNLFNEQKREFYILNDDISFDEWLKKLDRKTFGSDEPSEQADTVSSNEQNRVVVYCGTREVYDSMLASIKSLLCNTHVDHIVCFIEDDRFPNDDDIPPIVECVNVSCQNFFPSTGPNYDNAWTWMCMMRAAFPILLPQDKVLSLDVDTVIEKDISELWDLDMNGFYLAGVPEPGRRKTIMDPDYINFGVVMMNLRELRGVYKDIINLLNNQKLDCPEQTAFNRICAGKIRELPTEYNYTVYSHITGESDNPKILHYAGQKFWKHYTPVKKYADMSWADVMTSQDRIIRQKGEF